MLTGARIGQIKQMRWADIDDKTWTTPGAATKQKTDHHVPLSAPAQQLLSKLRDKADDDAV